MWHTECEGHSLYQSYDAHGGNTTKLWYIGDSWLWSPQSQGSVVTILTHVLILTFLAISATEANPGPNPQGLVGADEQNARHPRHYQQQVGHPNTWCSGNGVQANHHGWPSWCPISRKLAFAWQHGDANPEVDDLENRDRMKNVLVHGYPKPQENLPPSYKRLLAHGSPPHQQNQALTRLTPTR